MEHEFAGGRRSIEAFLEADEVDAVGLEVGDDFEEFAQGASESVEAGHAEAIARSGVVEELGKPGAVEALAGPETTTGTPTPSSAPMCVPSTSIRPKSVRNSRPRSRP